MKRSRLTQCICVTVVAIGTVAPPGFGAQVDAAKLPPPSQEKMDFARDIGPIFQKSCIPCHGPEKQKGKYRLDTKQGAFKEGDDGPFIVPGNSAKSVVVHMVADLVEEDLRMPPVDNREKYPALTREQIGKLRAWIDQGAAWPEGAGSEASKTSVVHAPPPDLSKLPPAVAKPVDFVQEIYPLFEERCIECHGPDKQKGKYRMDTKAGTFKPGEDGPFIIPGDSAHSPLVHMIAGLVPEGLMPPPSDKPGESEPLTKDEIGLIRGWIDQGAKWPDGPIPHVERQIGFERQIAPIFARACYECHGPQKQLGGFRMDQKEALMKGGDVYGKEIIPGDSKKSPLTLIVSGKDSELPFPEKHRLPPNEVERIAKWIDQGASW